MIDFSIPTELICVGSHRGQTRDARFATFEDRVVGLAEAALEVAERSGL